MNEKLTYKTLRGLLWMLILMAPLLFSVKLQAQTTVTGQPVQPAAADQQKPIADPAISSDASMAQQPYYRFYQLHPENAELQKAMKYHKVVNDPSAKSKFSAAELEAMSKHLEAMNRQLLQVQPLLSEGIPFDQALERVRSGEVSTPK